MAGQERRALGVVERRRQLHELRGRGDGFIAIGAVPHLDDHAITNSDTLGCIDFDHIAGGFDARRERQRRLELILARRHQDIGKIDPGGADSDAHLPRRQRRCGKRFQAQVLGRAEFAADDGFRHQAARAFEALQRLADQRHPVVAEIHVGLVDEDRRRTETAARHHLIGVGLELVLDRLLADALEELDVIDAGLLADLRQHRILRDVLVAAPIGLEHRGGERHHAFANYWPSQMQPRIALTLFTGNTVGGILIARPADRAQSARSFFM